MVTSSGHSDYTAAKEGVRRSNIQSEKVIMGRRSGKDARVEQEKDLDLAPKGFCLCPV